MLKDLEEFSTRVQSSLLYMCGVDVCEGGLQFCNTRPMYHTCETCSDVFSACFTYFQHHNCTQYCMDVSNGYCWEPSFCWFFPRHGGNEDLEEFPTRVQSSLLYMCGVDVCEGGLQFCNTRLMYHTCDTCSDVFSACFSQFQHYNCTQYCMDQWVQNMEAKETYPASVFKWLLLATVLGIVVLLILSVFSPLLEPIKRRLILACCPFAFIKQCLERGESVTGESKGKTSDKVDTEERIIEDSVLQEAEDVKLECNSPDTSVQGAGCAKHHVTPARPDFSRCTSQTDRKRGLSDDVSESMESQANDSLLHNVEMRSSVPSAGVSVTSSMLPKPAHLT